VPIAVVVIIFVGLLETAAVDHAGAIAINLRRKVTMTRNWDSQKIWFRQENRYLG
jgi:hypothetical protein